MSQHAVSNLKYYGKITPAVTALPIRQTLVLICHSKTKPVWQFKKQRIHNANLVDNMLMIPMVSKWNMGNYSCDGTDPSGLPFHAEAVVYVGGKNVLYVSVYVQAHIQNGKTW